MPFLSTPVSPKTQENPTKQASSQAFYCRRSNPPLFYYIYGLAVATATEGATAWAENLGTIQAHICIAITIGFHIIMVKNFVVSSQAMKTTCLENFGL